MTITEFLKDYLSQHGMSESEANAVLELMRQDESTKSMQGRWSVSKDKYPADMTKPLIHRLRELAVKWIKKNAPNAWFKVRFLQGD